MSTKLSFCTPQSGRHGQWLQVWVEGLIKTELCYGKCSFQCFYNLIIKAEGENTLGFMHHLWLLLHYYHSVAPPINKINTNTQVRIKNDWHLNKRHLISMFYWYVVLQLCNFNQTKNLNIEPSFLSWFREIFAETGLIIYHRWTDMSIRQTCRHIIKHRDGQWHSIIQCSTSIMQWKSKIDYFRM